MMVSLGDGKVVRPHFGPLSLVMVFVLAAAVLGVQYYPVTASVAGISLLVLLDGWRIELACHVPPGSRRENLAKKELLVGGILTAFIAVSIFVRLVIWLVVLVVSTAWSIISQIGAWAWSLLF